MKKEKQEEEMLTARKYAEFHEIPYTTVLYWLNTGRFPSAYRVLSPIGFPYWQIPKHAPKPITKRGPKPKSEDDE